MFIYQSKKCCQGQKCIHLFLDSEAYHEQMGSDGSLDMALSITQLRWKLRYGPIQYPAQMEA